MSGLPSVFPLLSHFIYPTIVKCFSQANNTLLSSWPEIGSDGNVLLTPYIPKGITGYDDDDDDDDDNTLWKIDLKYLEGFEMWC